MFPRSSGILLHVSSLPGPYGIGSLGKTAHKFVDFLFDAGQSYWQILPLVPTGNGNSPYMSHSSAAGNPLLIDLDLLSEMGLLTAQELDTAKYYAPDRVDYDFVVSSHTALLKKAFARIDDNLIKEISNFTKSQNDWLPDYALFMACHEKFDSALVDWPDADLIHRKNDILSKYASVLSDEINYHCFLQYLFFSQWDALKTYANSKGIKIIGDLPFYVSSDSVDVWVHPELFKLDKDLHSKVIAGVPPDMFSEDGQLWGNPIYNWSAHKKTGYKWWCNRVQKSMVFYDVLRFDHFRGFDTYWEIPVDAKSAKDGSWKIGPGNELIKTFKKSVPGASFIAEDLGDLTESAIKFIRESGLPGMRVMTDAFNDLSGSSSFLPHNCIKDAVMYTGTHDTPTFVEWLFEKASDDQRKYAMDYLRLDSSFGYGWGAISNAWESVCSLAIAPLQDVLGLGSDSRMNTPGTLGTHNWSWRVRIEAFNAEVAHKLCHITWLYGRLHR